MSLEKKRIVYFNMEAYIDTDITVLRELQKVYDVVWIPMIHEQNPRFSETFIRNYASTYNITLNLVKYSTRQSSFTYYFLILKVVLFIKRLKPSLIYSSTGTLAWAFFSSLLLSSKCKIAAFHDVEYHSNTSHLWLLKISDYLLRISNNNFVLFSQSQLDIFQNKYKREGHLVGMSSKDFGKSIVETPAIDKCVKLLFFGRIESYKGLDVLIASLETLYDKGYNNFSLSVYGKGACWNECKRYIKHKDLYNLQIRYIENEEIPDIMKNHHFLVLPYRDATQSGPIMISVNYGLPIIAPSINSFKDIYDEKSALFYEQGSLNTALEKAVNITMEEYSKMKEHCNSLKNRFSEERVSKNYIEYFERLLSVNNQ